MEKPIFVEPNIEYVQTLINKDIYNYFGESKRTNLQSDSDQDTEKTSPDGANPNADKLYQ